MKLICRAILLQPDIGRSPVSSVGVAHGAGHNKLCGAGSIGALTGYSLRIIRPAGCGESDGAEERLGGVDVGCSSGIS